MNEINESTTFGQSKYIPSYLKQFGKDMHKATINQQISFKERIKKHHNRNDIQMLLGRIEDMIDNKKSSNHFTTAIFAIMSFLFGSMMNYGVGILKKIDERAPYFLILYVAIMAVGIWLWNSIIDRRELRVLNRYKRLLQECLEELPAEKKSKRRFLKLTNKYRTP
ncbi:hypothetical protein R51_03150 [Bacillus safensis]|uniref:hypothetical protein n=1 Tax=Bacillus TaxID=1386 RepID=UPI00119CEBA2|nr:MULTISPECIES: hypothetical protein [Bacillus]GLF85270.1 hypothetical protein R51_03150 [Bacillus safensis]